VHRAETLDQESYFLRAMADVWRRQGWKITEQRGPGPRVDADLAILHVDLTVVPSDHMKFIRQYPIALNGGVADISKRATSSQLLRRGDRYNGPVIIKTNRNNGGFRERLLALHSPRWRKKLSSLRRRLPWAWQAELATKEYPILESAEQVPWGVWHNPDLVVERFQPERRDGFYCLRTWVFCGDRETHSLSWSEHPIVKSRNVVKREVLGEVPPDLRRMRKDLGFDFGKFDYAIVDGRVILYDANRTPTLGDMPREQSVERVKLLAEGIHAYL
jgi:hypothetical protein